MEHQTQLREIYAKKYERSSHSVGISMWHFEWCTKYRYKMFGKEQYKNLITACIRKAASMHEKAGLRYPRHHLWSPGKFAASLGFIQLEAAKNYVRNQDVPHSGSLAF